MVRVSGLRALEGDPRWTQSIVELLDAVDRYVPVPARELGEPFLMPIENVLTITGRGTVVTGAVERGSLAVGDAGRGRRARPDRSPRSVTGLETFGKSLESGRGRRQRGGAAARRQARRGAARPGGGAAGQRRRRTGGSGRSCTRCRPPRAAGTRRSPRTTGRSSTSAPRTCPADRPRRASTDGHAGRHGRADAWSWRKPVAMDVGLGFAVREGGRTVAAGTVTELLD